MVDFKLATFMYKTLHGRIPRYLSGDCQLISNASRQLRSSNTFTFAVPRIRTRLGDRLSLLQDHRYGTVCRQICTWLTTMLLLKGYMFG